MSNEITVLRSGDTLVPVSESFRQDLHEYPEKRQLVITIRYAEEKTDEMRAWLWYLVKKLREAGAWDGDSESCMDHLKIMTGYFSTIAGAPTFGEEITTLAGELLRLDRDGLAGLGANGPAVELLCKAVLEAGPRLHYVPKSIARGAISHQNMSRLVERIEHYIGTEWGIDVSQFKRQEATGRRTEAPPASAEPQPSARQQLEAATLYEALCAFGFELGMVDKFDHPGVEGLKAYWEKARKTKRIKALYEQAPKAIKALYDLAETNARVGVEKYDDEVRAIAAEAVKP